MKKLFFFLLLFSVHFLPAQNWLQSQDTLLDGVSCTPFFTFHNAQQWILGSYFRLFRFSNVNQTWQDADNGILPTHMNFTSLCQTGDTAYLNTYYNELYRSNDGGQNWTQVSPTGLPSDFSSMTLVSLNPTSNRIFMFNTSLYTSTDGTNWSQISVTNTPWRLGAHYFYWITPAGDSIVTLDNQLQAITIPRPSNSTFSLDGQYAFNWNQGDSGLYRLPLYQANPTWSRIGTLAADTIGSVQYNYFALGKTHIALFSNMSPSTNIISVRSYVSLDSGVTWTYRTDMKWVNYSSLFTSIAQDTLMSDDNTGGLHLSTDGGSTWHKWENHARSLNYLNAYMSPHLDTVIGNFRIDGSLNLGMIRSVDGGITWEIVNAGLPYIPFPFDSTLAYRLYSKPYKQGNAYFTTCYDGVSLYRSIDGGTTWQPSAQPNVNIMNDVGGDEDSHFLWTYIYATSVQNIYRSDDEGNTWTLVNLPLADSVNLYYGEDFLLQGKNDTFLLSFKQYQSTFPFSKLFYSTDNANTWSDITPPVCVGRIDKRLQFLSDALVNPVPRAFCFGADQTKLMVVVETRDTTSLPNYYNPPPVVFDSLYLYENNTWSKVNFSGLPNGIRMQQIAWLSGLWYLSSDVGVFSSSDDGVTWSNSGLRLSGGAQNTLSNNGLRLGMKMYGFGIAGNQIVSTTGGGGVWRFNINPIGIASTVIKENSMLVFPSPCTGNILYLNLSTTISNSIISIVDEKGRIVKQENARFIDSSRPYPIQVSGLAEGTYSIVISSAGKSEESKFVIVH